MLRRIVAIIKKETSQMLRDPATLVITIVMPIIEIILFGFAIRMNVKHIPTAVVDQSMDTASRAYINALVNSEYFNIVETLPNQAAVRRAIDDNRVQAGIVIPSDFEAKVARGDATALILVDGADPFLSLSAYSNANIITLEHSIRLVTDEMRLAGGAVQFASSFQPSMRILYNPDLKDLWFVIPGIVAMILQVQSIMLVVTAIVRERELGTMEQILVTPIRPIELLIGKMAPNIVFLGFNLGMILCITFFWFHVPFQGNLLLFFGLAFLYVFACMGLGLLVSTVAENQVQAFQLNMLILLMGLVVSGFIFPRNSVPPVINLLGYLFPLTYFIPISRGVISKGIGIEFLWPMVGVILLYALVILTISSKLFQQNME